VEADPSEVRQSRSRKPQFRPSRPQRLAHSALASGSCADEVDPIVKQVAWEWSFSEAGRQTFLSTAHSK
jgi:hypothetical protein